MICITCKGSGCLCRKCDKPDATCDCGGNDGMKKCSSCDGEGFFIDDDEEEDLNPDTSF